MLKIGTLLMLWVCPGLAAAGQDESTEPAVIILLLLGLIALIAGMSSLGDLRRKPLMPPRPTQAQDTKTEHEPPSADPEHPVTKA